MRTTPWDEETYRQTLLKTYPGFAFTFITQGNALFGGFSRDSTDLNDIYFHDKQHRLTVCTDALIINRSELFEKLNLTEDPSINSARLMCLAYQTWGKDFISHIDGDFAITIWDQAQNQFFAFRDRVGVRPLYLHTLEHGIACATYHGTLIPLLSVLEQDPIYVRNLVAGIFCWGTPYYTGTLYQGIDVVKPAHFLEWTSNRLTQTRYWDLRNNPMSGVPTLKEALEKFSELLHASVRKYVGAHDKIALEVSGGLDSGSVACLARAYFPDKPMQAFSNQFPENLPKDKEALKLKDEFPYAKALCEQLNIPLKGILPADFSTEEAYSALVQWLKGAFRHRFPLQHYPYYQQAKAFGSKVIFSGHGGDEYVSSRSYEMLWELKKSGQWLRYGYEMTRGFTISKTWQAIKHRLFKKDERGFKDKALRQNDALLRSCFPADWVDFIHQNQRSWDLIRSAKEREWDYYEGRYSSGMQGRLESSYLVGQFYGVYYCYPLLDAQLLQYYHHLPSTYKRRHGRGRYLFYLALKPFFPKKHLEINTKRIVTPSAIPPIDFLESNQPTCENWPEQLKKFKIQAENTQRLLQLSVSKTKGVHLR